MTNPLIDDLRDKDLIQTVSITLPTKGMFYEDGILAPGTDPDDLEIRAIGVMAEMYARDPFMVAAGKGLARIVSHVCPSVLRPDRLCEVDVEAILIAARLVSHGPSYQIKHRCENPARNDDDEPVCSYESDVEIDLQKTIMNYEPIEYDEQYIVDIPEFGQKVYLKPMEYRHALNVVKRSFLVEREFRGIVEAGLDKFFESDDISEDYAKAIDKGAEIALQSYAESIFCVESAAGVKVANVDQIMEWLDILPEDIGKRVSDAIGALAEKLREKSQVKYTCPSCGHDNSFQLVMDPERLFFSKPSTSKPPKKPSATSKRSRRPGTKPPRTSRKSPTPSQESVSNT